MKIEGIEGTFVQHKIKGKKYWYHRLYEIGTGKRRQIYVGKDLDAYIAKIKNGEFTPTVTPKKGTTVRIDNEKLQDGKHYQELRIIVDSPLIQERSLVNFYTVLGIPPFSRESVIKEAFRKLSLKYHPDRNNDPQAGAVFDLIRKAHDRLLQRIQQYR